uniref:Uncharacterized protein n=1 Tax=Zea mays TaxID=4577 RepID=B6T6X6_MAIZE|nr:hypothetical protein [Zea mays]
MASTCKNIFIASVVGSYCKVPYNGLFILRNTNNSKGGST